MAIEFLIKRTDGEWFDLNKEQFGEAFRPTSFPSEPAEGWGDYRIKVLGCEVSFSYEDPGIPVCFEGQPPSAETAKQIVNEIAANIARITGQEAEVVEM